MKLRASPRRALAVCIACLLGGCSSLPFLDHDGNAAQAAAPAPDATLYELSVEAPGPLRALLLQYLDLARFQKAPAAEAITSAEIDRLAAVAPAQARAQLETEGYFDADVKIARAPGPASVPRLTLTVVPGPRVLVEHVSIDAATPLLPREPTRDEPAADRLGRLRRTWLLPAGQPFRQADWNDAKNAALAELRADGYPLAAWQQTRARVDAAALTAGLDLVIDGGPLYKLGTLNIEGVSRYDELAVRRLATFFPGAVYSEKLLLDYQDRLVKSGLFEGASVELDVTGGTPDAAPVLVKVKELPQHQATFGVGYSANTGPRVSVEHYDRRLFGQPWIAHSKLSFGPDLKSIGTELTSYPLPDLYRNVLSANIEQLLAADETRDSWTLRGGRSQETTRIDRFYYLEVTHAKVASAPLVTSSTASSANYRWLRRDVDNPLSPTDGTVILAQGGAGFGSGTETRSDQPGERESRSPFVRAYARLNAYRPIGGWLTNARVEAGEVFVKDRIAVPDTVLFRAGGDDSVRGYAYRTLGPSVNGAVVGGRVLLTGSLEAEHKLTDRVPSLLGAVFVDSGGAADRWTDFHLSVGYGVGLHYRSPVGPIRLDVAYGQDVKRFRLHLSAGVAF